MHVVDYRVARQHERGAPRAGSGRRKLCVGVPDRQVHEQDGFLASLTALTLSFAELSHSLPIRARSEAKQFAVTSLWMYLESLLVLLTLNPLGTGGYPSNRYAPKLHRSR
jgi:hypothetical protein